MRLWMGLIALGCVGCYEAYPPVLTGVDAEVMTGDAGGPISNGDAGPLPASTCGNGIVERFAIPAEYCDDGNLDDDDGCDSNCTRLCVAPAPHCTIRDEDGCVDAFCDVDGDQRCHIVPRPAGDTCSGGPGCVANVCTTGAPPLCGGVSAAECTLVRDVDPTAIAVRNGVLYWTEYGGFDSLGNFGFDGTLHARPLDGGPEVTLASGLEGPVELGVTDTHAYFAVDRHRGAGGALSEAILRVPVTGGEAELLVDGRRMVSHDCPQCFVAIGDRAFFPLLPDRREIQVASAEEPSPRTFVVTTGHLMAMAVQDGELVYAQELREGGGELHTVTLDGVDTGDTFTLPSPNAFAVTRDRILSFEDFSAHLEADYLVSTWRHGEPWTRFATLPAPRRLRTLTIVDGDRWIGESIDSHATADSRIYTGILDSPTVTNLPVLPYRAPYVVTDDGFFVVNAYSIRRIRW
jgi:cysteine-rich repeat protein